MPIWVRKNGGIWNNDAGADPATNTGGIPLNLHPASYIIQCLGSDTHFIFNFGASAFTYTVPAGFTAGWPDGSGWATLDPDNTTNATLDDGNLGFHGGVNGSSQVTSRNTSGAYYFEYENVFNTFFTTDNDVILTDGVSGYVGITGGGLGVGFVQQLANQAGFLLNPAFPPPSITGNGTVISFAVILEPVTFTGVGATAHVGTFGIDTTPEMMLSAFQCIEPLPSTDNHYVTLRTSSDGGVSFDNGRQQSIGAPGEYFTDTMWNRIGYGRNKVIEISWSCPQATALTGAWIRYTIAGT